MCNVCASFSKKKNGILIVDRFMAVLFREKANRIQLGNFRKRRFFTLNRRIQQWKSIQNWHGYVLNVIGFQFFPSKMFAFQYRPMKIHSSDRCRLFLFRNVSINEHFDGVYSVNLIGGFFRGILQKSKNRYDDNHTSRPSDEFALNAPSNLQQKAFRLF